MRSSVFAYHDIGMGVCVTNINKHDIFMFPTYLFIQILIYVFAKHDDMCRLKLLI